MEEDHRVEVLVADYAWAHVLEVVKDVVQDVKVNVEITVSEHVE